MRQALARTMVGLCLVLVPAARGEGPLDRAEQPLSQARRRAQAGDHASAANILEEALFAAKEQDRQAILDLLKQSYEVLARKAEASGQTDVAAHYRDNLAILDRGREATRKSPPSASRAQTDAPSTVPPGPAPVENTSPPSPRGPAILSQFLGITARDNAPRAQAASPAGQVASPAGQVASPPGQVASPAGQVASPPGQASSSALTPVPRINAFPDSKPADATPAAEYLPERRPPAGPNLTDADRLFQSRRYDEAERAYSALARLNRLPPERRPHWAYCRWVAVVRRINGRPRSAREWDEIEAEVQNIQRLTPGSWYGEYLCNWIGEARRSGRRPPASRDNLVIRGSAPDDDQTARSPRLFGRLRGSGSTPSRQGDTAAPPSASAGAEKLLALPGAATDADAALPARNSDQDDAPRSRPASSTDAPGQEEPDIAAQTSSRQGTKSPPAPAHPAGGAPRIRVEDGSPAQGEPADSEPITWRIHETPNFRIYHCDPALALRTAEVAESVRTAQGKQWNNPAARSAWIPRCDLYLYPTARAYALATGQPEVSPGVSTMSSNGAHILSRRMNLRADNPQLLTTILPHEVTHIVLADLFIVQQIPRWADEGIAVLAEPLREQHLRAAELQGPLESGQLFDLARLMVMD
jgi:hypothetical protein